MRKYLAHDPRTWGNQAALGHGRADMGGMSPEDQLLITPDTGTATPSPRLAEARNAEAVNQADLDSFLSQQANPDAGLTQQMAASYQPEAAHTPEAGQDYISLLEGAQKDRDHRQLFNGITSSYEDFVDQAFGTKTNPQSRAARDAQALNPIADADAKLRQYLRGDQEKAQLAREGRAADLSREQMAALNGRSDAALKAQLERDKINADLRKYGIDSANMRSANAQATKKELAAKKHGKGGGKAAGAAAELKSFTDEEIDAMDITPAQKKAAKVYRDAGKFPQFAQIVNSETKVVDERNKDLQKTGGAQDDIIANGEELLGLVDPASGTIKGMGGGLGDRFATTSGGGILGDAARGLENLAASTEDQKARSLYEQFASKERHELFGATLTGGEKASADKIFAMASSSDPKVRVEGIKRYIDLAKKAKSRAAAPRRNASAAPLPATAGERVKVVNAATGQVGYVPAEKVEAAIASGRFKKAE